jgi:hypothetical protein
LYPAKECEERDDGHMQLVEGSRIPHVALMGASDTRNENELTATRKNRQSKIGCVLM